MSDFAWFAVALVALIHVVAMIAEMKFWPALSRRLFPDAPDSFTEAARPLVVNQGLYNGFLAVGLVWSLLIDDPVWETRVATCFLIFVFIAGVFGAVTVTRSTLVVQSLFAAVAMALVWLT